MREEIHISIKNVCISFIHVSLSLPTMCYTDRHMYCLDEALKLQDVQDGLVTTVYKDVAFL